MFRRVVLGARRRRGGFGGGFTQPLPWERRASARLPPGIATLPSGSGSANQEIGVPGRSTGGAVDLVLAYVTGASY